MQLDHTWASRLAPAVPERQAPGRAVPGRGGSRPQHHGTERIFSINHHVFLIEIKCHKTEEATKSRVNTEMSKKKNVQLNPNDEKRKTEE